MKKIYKALHLPLIYLTVFAALNISSTIKAESITTENGTHIICTPEQKALAVFNDFFTNPDPNHVIEKSFYEMCLEVIPHLEKSEEKELRDLAGVLKTVCNKNNLYVIGAALKKYVNVITKYLGDNIVDGNILKKRIITALSKK